MNHKSALIVAVPSHVIIHLNDISKINMNAVIHCMYVNFAIEDIVPRIHWQRTSHYNIVVQVACYDAYWKQPLLKMLCLVVEHQLHHLVRSNILTLLFFLYNFLKKTHWKTKYKMEVWWRLWDFIVVNIFWFCF